MSRTDPRSILPAVEAVRLDPALADVSKGIRAEIVVRFVRSRIEQARLALEQARTVPSAGEIARQVASDIQTLLIPSPRRAINATGVILHTGLGRAPLGDLAVQAIVNAARNCDLELELATGERGDRQTHVELLLTVLTGAQSALVVNNNAAALYLTLNSLAYKREVIVSRGQLIEIGGSFRLPQIMERAGVKLVEVGTTNRTRIADYREAISPKTALLLRAYPSNYRIDGFEESVSIKELVALGREHGLPVVDDLGGGLLWDWTALGLPYEPTVRESIDAGADLVLVSGDKVLGGSQAGIAMGRAELVAKLKKSPLARVVRADKLSLAALNATLRSYLITAGPQTDIPVWQMLTESLESLAQRGNTLLGKVKALGEWKVAELGASNAETGSGTLPAVALPSMALRLQPARQSVSRLAKRLRQAKIPIIGTIQQDLLQIDLRTLRPQDEADFLISLSEAVRKER